MNKNYTSDGERYFLSRALHPDTPSVIEALINTSSELGGRLAYHVSLEVEDEGYYIYKILSTAPVTEKNFRTDTVTILIEEMGKYYWALTIIKEDEIL